jgi:hypothetical protein
VSRRRAAARSLVPLGNRSLDSPAPGRKGDAGPRPLPKAPATRAVAPSSSGKTKTR